MVLLDDARAFVTDDWFVVAISDANFGRYGITAQDLKRVMSRNPKVHTALICIGEGAEATWYVLDTATNKLIS